MRVDVEIRVDEVRDLPGKAVKFEDIGAFNLSQIGPAASFENAKDWIKLLNRTSVNVKGIRQQFANGRPFASLVNRFGISGTKQQFVGLLACL